MGDCSWKHNMAPLQTVSLKSKMIAGITCYPQSPPLSPWHRDGMLLAEKSLNKKSLPWIWITEITFTVLSPFKPEEINILQKWVWDVTNGEHNKLVESSSIWDKNTLQIRVLPVKEQVSFDLRTICTNAPWRGYRNWKRIAFRWRSRAGKSCCLAGRHHNNTLITIIITLLIKATNWTFNLVVLSSLVRLVDFFLQKSGIYHQKLSQKWIEMNILGFYRRPEALKRVFFAFGTCADGEIH